MNDSWSSGNPYEQFMGRWSALIAQKFLDWLAVPPDGRWLDIGCGTGVLTKLILEANDPKEVIGVDSSSKFISHAQQAITNPLARFEVGLAEDLALESNLMDAVVSGIMLNFVPDPETAVQEMMRVTRSGGQIGIFLWDYADGMEMLRYFWETAVKLHHRATEFDEGIRFPLCQKGQLESLVKKAGLKQVEATAIEVPTLFQSFDDYWSPFLGHVGPAPSYSMSLSQSEQQKLENKLREILPIAENGTIPLTARAWAVKGTPS